MSINKALKQVMMYEEIGGKKKENPQPTDTNPVRMPEAPKPAGPKPKSTRGVNAPPPKRPLPFPFPSDTTRETQPKPIRPGSQPRPIPANGGAEVTPPQGLAEKAFWKQRLTNQLNEKRQLGVLKGAAGKVLGHYWGPWGDAIGKIGDKWKEYEDDRFREITHDYDNPESPYYQPNRDIFRNFPLEVRPNQGSDGVYRLPSDVGGGWVGGNSPSGSGGTRTV